mmetsp:Transcript_13197/g.26789  ORF Transcript_13197/g.26789 Transcript_13197/m.26789 type:complete len:91 (+) Transcript_13197:92-364(+)
MARSGQTDWMIPSVARNNILDRKKKKKSIDTASNTDNAHLIDNTGMSRHWVKDSFFFETGHSLVNKWTMGMNAFDWMGTDHSPGPPIPSS